MRFHKFILRRLPDKERLRRSFLYRVFGKSILARDLWRLDARSVAGGFSIGLFIAFTPTIPLQMVLACMAVLYFRANLPAALLACWVTNPLTAVPIYMTALRVGRSVLHAMPFATEYLLVYDEARQTRFIMSTFYLWTGALILGTAAACTSNLLLRWLWKEASLHRPGRKRSGRRKRGEVRREKRLQDASGRQEGTRVPKRDRPHVGAAPGPAFSAEALETPSAYSLQPLASSNQAEDERPAMREPQTADSPRCAGKTPVVDGA